MSTHVQQGDSAGGDLGGTFPSPTVSPASTLNHLPKYGSLALATGAGLASGDYFILTGTVLGLETLNLIVQKP